jgi:ribokinase
VGTALATLATFGVTTAVYTRVGDDDFGRFILRGLEELGIDIRGVRPEPGKISPFSFIAVERQSGKRNIFYTRGSISPLAKEEVDLGQLAESRVLLVDGHHPAAQLHAAEHARAHGVQVVLDAGSLREGMGDLMEMTDILIASERFATEVAPSGELEDCLHELAKLGPRTVVVTLGSEGSIGLESGRVVRAAPIEVPVVDTTGAGDVYHGAFIYGMLENWPLERKMRFASVAAGLKCRHLGGRAGIPELSEVLSLA